MRRATKVSLLDYFQDHVDVVVGIFSSACNSSGKWIYKKTALQEMEK